MGTCVYWKYPYIYIIGNIRVEVNIFIDLFLALFIDALCDGLIRLLGYHDSLLLLYLRTLLNT